MVQHIPCIEPEFYCLRFADPDRLHRAHIESEASWSGDPIVAQVPHCPRSRSLKKKPALRIRQRAESASRLQSLKRSDVRALRIGDRPVGTGVKVIGQPGGHPSLSLIL